MTAFTVALVELVAAAVVLYAPDAIVWLRMIVGIPFLLVLPGLALVLYVDPEACLGSFEWFALCIGTSVAIVALTAVALAATLGLTGPPLVGALVLIELALLSLSAFNRQAGCAPVTLPRRRSPLRRATAATAGLLGMATLILALTNPQLGVERSGNIVQLWGVPDSQGSVSIGAANIDAPARNFTLTIQQHGQTIAAEKLDLPAGTSRRFELQRSAIPANDAPVTAALEDASRTVAPRTISVWASQ